MFGVWYLIGVFFGFGLSIMIKVCWECYGTPPFREDGSFKGDLKSALFWILFLPLIFGLPIAGIIQAFYNSLG